MRCGDGQVLLRGRLGAAQPASSARVRRTRADRPLFPQPASASSAVLRARAPDFGGFCVSAPCACAPAAAVARRERRLCLLQQLEHRLAGGPAGLVRVRAAFGCCSRPSSPSVFMARSCVSRAPRCAGFAAAPVVLVVLARHVVLGVALSDLDARASLFDARVDLALVYLFWSRLPGAHNVEVAIAACDRARLGFVCRRCMRRAAWWARPRVCASFRVARSMPLLARHVHLSRLCARRLLGRVRSAGDSY